LPTWAKCGGRGHNGPTKCQRGDHCKRMNDRYSQCVPK
jgi:hypothetical protein